MRKLKEKTVIKWMYSTGAQSSTMFQLLSYEDRGGDQCASIKIVYYFIMWNPGPSLFPHAT